MKLISMKCPHCSGTLEVSPDAKQAKCPYCNTQILIDDEVQHVQFDNSEQAGYDFEKGRIKAQQDAALRQAEIERARVRATQEAERKKKNRVWWILGWIFFFPIPLTVLIAKSKKLKPVLKIIFIAALWASVILIGALSNGNGKETRAAEYASQSSSKDKATWAVEYTPLTDFKYYVDGDSIVLTDYTGTNRTVNIAPEYEIDGTRLHVTALESVFTLERISSAIIPEGVTSIKDNAFNSCGVKNLYLPSTLADFNGWSYFHNGEKLYYGGTEEQWAELFKDDRKDLDFTQIIFNAKVEDLINANEE